MKTPQIFNDPTPFLGVLVAHRLRTRIFDQVEIECMPTGSAIYGIETPSDLDYICLDRDGLFTELECRGWDSTGFQSGDGKFRSLRKGFVNLILGDPDFVGRWICAHDYLMLNPGQAKTKEGRIYAFELYGAGKD